MLIQLLGNQYSKKIVKSRDCSQIPNIMSESSLMHKFEVYKSYQCKFFSNSHDSDGAIDLYLTYCRLILDDPIIVK